MSHLPHPLYRAAQVRELDRLVIDYYGVHGIALMNAAGQALFDELRRSWPEIQRIAVVCGAGNNAGDGYVAARLAHQAGIEVELYFLVAGENLLGDAHRAWAEAEDAGVSMIVYDGQRIDGHDLIIDALLGTGLDRPVEGLMAEAIEAINGAGVPVIAADIPSGLSADTGCALGSAVRADVTVSFIGLKRGLFCADGPDHCGRLLFEDLHVPHAIYGHQPAGVTRIDYVSLGTGLAPRPRNAHKGDFGHVLVVGGHQGMAGAVRLAGEAALRIGAGLVSLASHPAHANQIAAARPELICHGVDGPAQLTGLLQQASVVVVGPGLGQDPWGQALLACLLELSLPMVLDADALNLLAQEPIRSDKWVLTPHPGEAARMLGVSTADVQQDRFAAIHALQDKYGGVVVLKGCGSLILDAGGELSLCSDGNPGMSSAGVGDVLSGVIAGLIAQGLCLEEAARVGVCVHAHAGDLAAREGERGLLASDLFSHLRRLVNLRTY
ncbi:MAG: NAD(P)H-hydrate dehydratase [Thiohalomonadaceae bacterium]